MTRPIDTQMSKHAVASSWRCPDWRRFFVRALSLAASMAVFISLSSIPSHAENTDPRIAKIKAAFAYTLAKFVEWPGDAFKDTHSPLIICVAADDVYAAALRSLQGKAVKNRPIAVWSLGSRTSLGDCHVAMLSAGPVSVGSQRSAREHHVLTIGSGRDFAHAGGMVASYFVKNKLRFSINRISVREAGLTISSRALGLAQEVIQE